MKTTENENHLLKQYILHSDAKCYLTDQELLDLHEIADNQLALFKGIKEFELVRTYFHFVKTVVEGQLSARKLI